jgi:phospholipase C
LSGATGEFRVAGLPPADYEVSAELPGFAAETHPGITVAVGQTVTSDFQLRVLEVAVHVDVSVDPAVVDTERASQSNSVSERRSSSPDQSILSQLSNSVLAYFRNFQDPTSQLYRNAFLPQFPLDFLAEALSGNLPQVSWILASVVDSDHPPAPSLFGESSG